MREKFKSFLWGYLSIPIVFYAVDMACQIAFMQGGFWDILLLTMILVSVNGFIFWRILAQKRFLIDSPWSLAFGAVIGLWHFFIPYLIVGSYGLWKTVPVDNQSLTLEDVRYLAVSLLNPAFNFYQWQCDGSLSAVVLSVAVFCGIILKLEKTKK